jgi:hypothetical protein
LGTSSLPVVCHPARSSSRTAWRPQRHCVRFRRGEAASCQCPRRARREPLRHREQDRSRRIDRRCRSAGRRAVWAAFHAGPTGERGRSSGRSGLHPYMRVPLFQVKAVPSSERPFAPSRHRRLDWDRVHSSERCITLHTVPVAGALTDPDRRPQCLMHETSTPDDATHLERGSTKLPMTKTVVSSNRSPRSPTIEAQAARMAPSGTTPTVMNRQIATSSFRAIATIAIRRVRPLSSPM